MVQVAGHHPYRHRRHRSHLARRGPRRHRRPGGADRAHPTPDQGRRRRPPEGHAGPVLAPGRRLPDHHPPGTGRRRRSRDRRRAGAQHPRGRSPRRRPAGRHHGGADPRPPHRHPHRHHRHHPRNPRHHITLRLDTTGSVTAWGPDGHPYHAPPPAAAQPWPQPSADPLPTWDGHRLDHHWIATCLAEATTTSTSSIVSSPTAPTKFPAGNREAPPHLADEESGYRM